MRMFDSGGSHHGTLAESGPNRVDDRESADRFDLALMRWGPYIVDGLRRAGLQRRLIMTSERR